MPPVNAKHCENRGRWARKHMKVPMKHVLFTNESRLTLDEPDNWLKGRVLEGDEGHSRIHRQQCGGGVMMWAGIIDHKLVGSIRVP